MANSRPELQKHLFFLYVNEIFEACLCEWIGPVTSSLTNLVIMFFLAFLFVSMNTILTRVLRIIPKPRFVSKERDGISRSQFGILVLSWDLGKTRRIANSMLISRAVCCLFVWKPSLQYTETHRLSVSHKPQATASGVKISDDLHWNKKQNL